MTLIEFLLARIAEDRERASAAKWAMQGKWFTSGSDDVERFVHALTPDHVLAECEAKRRMIEACQGYQSAAEHNAQMGIADNEAVLRAQGARHVLRWLALPYRDHPDCDPEWIS